jgi:hypothetical protein
MWLEKKSPKHSKMAARLHALAKERSKQYDVELIERLDLSDAGLDSLEGIEALCKLRVLVARNNTVLPPTPPSPTPPPPLLFAPNAVHGEEARRCGI